MTVAITRAELSAGDLRREAARCRDARAARRMLALALVLEGHSRAEAARHAGMDRQTLRDWVHRYNSLPSGLTGGPRVLPDCVTGPPPGTEAAAHQRADQDVGGDRGARTGPGARRRGALAADRPAGADRDALWRPPARALHGSHRDRMIAMGALVGKLLRRLGFARLSVRPKHPLSDPQAQEAFKKLRRAGEGGAAGAGPWQADRGLVPG